MAEGYTPRSGGERFTEEQKSVLDSLWRSGQLNSREKICPGLRGRPKNTKPCGVSEFQIIRYSDPD